MWSEQGEEEKPNDVSDIKRGDKRLRALCCMWCGEYATLGCIQ